MHCVILSRQIGHYHNARFRGASAHLDRVTVLSCAGEGFFAEFSAKQHDGYAVETLSESREQYAHLVTSGAFSGRVYEALDRLRPDAVAAPGWASAESYAALEWARRNQVPVVVMAESQADDVDRSFVKEAIKRRVVRQFDAALVGGYSSRDYLSALGMASSRISLGYNAVENDHFASGGRAARADAEKLRAEHGLPPRYFLASGRFIRKKNFPALVRAWARAAEELGAGFPDLIILGDGEGRAEIEAEIATAGANGRVHLPGYRGYDVLPIYYGLSLGFVHVAMREQWGLVINEGMASGVPVVASKRCGATRTLLADGTGGGIPVDPQDEAGIARALAEIAGLTEEDWQKRGDAARAAVSDWGPERFGAGLASAIEAARGRRPRGALPMWDRALLRRLGRRIQTDVD